MSTPTPAPQRRTVPVVLVVAALAVAVVVGAIAAGALYIKTHQYLVMDEWTCSRGEAPYVFKQGGSACAKVGSTLPRGAHWDPLGNVPFDCTNRPGWILIMQDRTTEISCFPDDKAIPHGWSPVH